MAQDYAKAAAMAGRRDGAVLPLGAGSRADRRRRRGDGVPGPNGAGKTTTIDMILGLSRPDAGAVEVYGMAPRQAVRKGLVAAVMQTGGLLKDLTVAETVQYTARLFAVTRPAAEVLERAGIIAIAGRRVGKCSGGEQQRLRFAMALIPDPELLSFPGRESTGRIPGCRTTRSPCLCGELGVLSN